MKIITGVSDMRLFAEAVRMQGKKIGFVPTMGFLHEGHLSLMRKAREENGLVVASIFVNPTQFSPGEDLDRYPRDPEGDQKKCISAQVDVLFTPSAEELYAHPGVFVTVEGLSDVLEGAIRPNLFRGVATVVTKLFHLVKPHKAYFGQKDYHQSLLLRRMVEGLNFDVELVVLPTVREEDGLAMSSRNSYLEPEERKAAAAIPRAVNAVEHLFKFGMRASDTLEKTVRDVFAQVHGAKVDVDYVEIVDAETLEPVKTITRRSVLLVAVRLGKTRLIDNLLLQP